MIKSWHFNQKYAVQSDYLSINGYAIDEPMRPCVVNRPKGTGDWLFMVFKTPVDLLINGCQQRAPSNTLMIWPPGNHQYYGNLEAPFSHSWIHCLGSLVQQSAHLCSFPAGKPIHDFDTTCFEAHLAGIHYEFDHFQAPDERVIANHLQNLFYLIQRYAGTKQPSPQVPDGIRRARGFLEANHTRPVTLKEAAQEAGVSVSHFCLGFKKAYGVSPIDYLIRFRLSEALHQLKDRNKRISEVAYANGFEDVYYFSKMVKKRFGKSPRDLRE